MNNLGDVSMDLGQSAHNQTNFMSMGKSTNPQSPPLIFFVANISSLSSGGNQPNIHPGCISSTGRARNSDNTINGTNLLENGNLSINIISNQLVMAATQQQQQLQMMQPQLFHLTSDIDQVSDLNDRSMNSSSISSNCVNDEQKTTTVDAPMLSAMESMFKITSNEFNNRIE